jgi:carboxylesterase
MPGIHPLIKNPHLEGDPFHLEGGPTGILLVHGFTATTAEMRPLGEYLHSKGYSVSAPLLPGHNTCPEDINNYRWGDWVSEVEAAYLVLARRTEQVFIGGESTGGLLALYLASCHPEISGVLTYAPALKLVLRPVDVFKLHLIAPFIPYIRQDDVEDDGLAWQGYMAKPLKGVIQLLRLQKKTLPRLPAIRRPTLIIQGSLDTTVDPGVPQIIYDNISSIVKEIHWMKESSHCVVLDKEFDQVKEITLNFIQKALG